MRQLPLWPVSVMLQVKEEDGEHHISLNTVWYWHGTVQIDISCVIFRVQLKVAKTVNHPHLTHTTHWTFWIYHHNNTRRQVFLVPFYRWGNWRLSKTMVTRMVKLDFISSSYRSCHVATSVRWKWREGNEASIICFLVLCYLEKSLTSLRLVF